jgi:hypothetical protein
LCCVALPFSASADFAIDKDAGRPCPNLQADFRCGVHDSLRERGFPGCVVFDCFGAGQHVSQVTFGGRDWRRDPGVAKRMFAVFPIMRQLHELLWYLGEALTLQPARPVHGEVRRAMEEVEGLTRGDPGSLTGLDVAAHRRKVGVLLARASELAREGAGPKRKDRAGADLIGARLGGADLRGACFRGSVLVGAVLSGADLRSADFLGADLRGADVRGADLTGAIFLIQSQLDAARGDADTRLPPSLTRPPHWSQSQSQSADSTAPTIPAAPARSRSRRTATRRR